jgi:hypothetical protein
MKCAYNNRKSKNSIQLSTLKKNKPTDMPDSDLKNIFLISKSRLHFIPEKTQTFSITLDERSFLEKYNLHKDHK